MLLNTSFSFTITTIHNEFLMKKRIQEIQNDDVFEEDYLEYATPNRYMDRCMMVHDRLLDRTIDNSKLLKVTGLTMDDFTTCYDGLVTELEILASRPDLVARFDTPGFRKISERMDAYLENHKRG